MDIPAFKPMQGRTAEQIVDEHKRGLIDVYFVRAGGAFLQGGKRCANKVTKLRLAGPNLKAGDQHSTSGNEFLADGRPVYREVENVYLVARPKDRPLVAALPDGVMKSDTLGITAFKPAPKAAPPALPPAPTKNSAGLLTLHDPDRPTIWGERVA